MSEGGSLLKTADVFVGVLAAAGFAAFVVAGLEPGAQRATAPELPAASSTGPEAGSMPGAGSSGPDAGDVNTPADTSNGDTPETPAGQMQPSPAPDPSLDPAAGAAASQAPQAASADPEPSATSPAPRQVTAAPPPQVVTRPGVAAPPPPLPAAVGTASVPRIDPSRGGDGFSGAGPGSSGSINPALIPRNPTMQFIVRLTGEDRLRFRDAFVADPDQARAEFARWASQHPAFEGMELRRVSFNGELTLVYSAEPGLDDNAMTALSQRLAARLQTNPTVDYADPDTLGGKGEADQ